MFHIYRTRFSLLTLQVKTNPKGFQINLSAGVYRGKLSLRRHYILN